MKRKLFLPFMILLCAFAMNVKLFADDLKIVANAGDLYYYLAGSNSDNTPNSNFSNDSNYNASCRFELVTNDGANLVFSNAHKSKPGTSKVQSGYIPFKISDVEIPAYTKRTYNLTFNLTIETSGGSGCYYYVEVIQGDVPSNFNTSEDDTKEDLDTSAAGTKLRFRITKSSSVKSNSITLSYTFDNLDGSSSKTFSFPGFVFMGGHRETGAYEPRPTFTLTFSGEIDYSKDVYKIVPTATHCSKSSGAETVARENAYTATFTADSYYHLPESVSVSVGGTALSSSDYTWSKVTGRVSVSASLVTSYIGISVEAEPNVYSITYNKNGGTNDGTPDAYTYSVGATLPDATKITRTGYTFNGWYASADFSGEAITEVSATDHDDKTFYAKWTAIEYTITLVGNLGGNDGTSGTASIKSTIEKTVSLTDRGWAKNGHTLLGWCAKSDLSDTPITQISKKYYASGVTLYAKWSDHVYDDLAHDGTHHWYTCKCNEIDPAGKTTHLGHYDSWCISDTSPQQLPSHSFSMKRKCSVCGYEEIVAGDKLHKH